MFDECCVGVCRLVLVGSIEIKERNRGVILCDPHGDGLQTGRLIFIVDLRMYFLENHIQLYPVDREKRVETYPKEYNQATRGEENE